MDGYKSKPEMRLSLAAGIIKAWGVAPELRLGQLISCVVKDADLFAIYDEQLLGLLEAFADEHSTDPR